MAAKILTMLDGNVAVLRIDDPASLNALSVEMVHALREAALASQSSARALVLCGAGPAFCSGANLTGGMGLDAMGQPDFDAGRLIDEAINPLMLALRNLAIPWLSAVRGPAAGFGAALALSADLIVAGESAYFLQAFRRIGLVPDGGSTYLLARAAGRVRAMEMMLLGEKVPALRALEWGLINRVVPDEAVEETALALARELAAGPTRALGLIRRAAWRANDADLESALAAERDAQREAGLSPDFKEGIDAFLGKRRPRFTGA